MPGSLRLSRGFFPVVAIGDPFAGNLSPGVLSPPGSPSSKGGKGKTKKGKGKGDKFPSANFKFNKYPAKVADPRGRAKSLTCLRCGQPGHFAAQCPVKPSSSSTGGGNKRPAPGPTESMVRLEDAHVPFMDQHGYERHDVTMLGPGASAFLCGYGALRRYLDYLKACNFPVETIEFNRCCRKFCFAGDGESWWFAFLCVLVDFVAELKCLSSREKPLCYVEGPSLKLWALFWTSPTRRFGSKMVHGHRLLWDTMESILCLSGSR